MRLCKTEVIRMRLLSVVVPCYNEEENVADFYWELMKIQSYFQEKDIELEIWYINSKKIRRN